jgi:hypothetical protein
MAFRISVSEGTAISPFLYRRFLFDHFQFSLFLQTEKENALIALTVGRESNYFHHIVAPTHPLALRHTW